MKIAYPLKHWITTLVLAPTIYVVGKSLDISFVDQSFWLALVAGLLISIIASVPVFLISVLVYNFLVRKMRDAAAIKVILNVIAIGGMSAILLINRRSDMMQFAWCYVLAITISSLFYRIKKVRNKVDQQGPSAMAKNG